MKKALFTTIILCAVAITSSAQELPWFWHENDYALKGHVKEVREYHIEMRGDPELQDTDYYFYTYSPDGIPTTISTPTPPMGIYSPSTLMMWTNFVTIPTIGARISTRLSAMATATPLSTISMMPTDVLNE